MPGGSRLKRGREERLAKGRIRASTMETYIFGFLNGSHVYTSLIYNFLI